MTSDNIDKATVEGLEMSGSVLIKQIYLHKSGKIFFIPIFQFFLGVICLQML